MLRNKILSLPWINKQGVKSDKAFTVQSIDGFVIRYSANHVDIDISVEYGKKANDYFVYIYKMVNFINGMMDEVYQKKKARDFKKFY